MRFGAVVELSWGRMLRWEEVSRSPDKFIVGLFWMMIGSSATPFPNALQPGHAREG